MEKFSYCRIAFALLLAVAACGQKGHDAKELAGQEAIPVTIVPLSSQDTAQRVTVTGTFTTDDETVLAFKNGGVIQTVRVKAGDAFKKGQLLAALEPTEINTAVRQSQLAVEKTERDYNRARQLYLDSVATLEQLENAQTALAAAKQDAQRATYNLGHMAIHASSDGYVLQRMANAGQVVGPGTPVLMVSGTGRNGWLLQVGVSDRQWSAVRLGDRALVTTDAANGASLPAAVSRKSEGIDPQSGTFIVYLKLDGGQLPALASGMFGRAEIQLSAETGVWLIPYEALLDGDAGKGYVFVTRDGKTAQRVEVRVAGMQRDHVVVTEGLEQGGSLIVAGSPYLRDGSEITIN